jgi:hypothetical protein
MVSFVMMLMKLLPSLKANDMMALRYHRESGISSHLFPK